jgi:hypothetical protein
VLRSSHTGCGVLMSAFAPDYIQKFLQAASKRGTPEYESQCCIMDPGDRLLFKWPAEVSREDPICEIPLIPSEDIPRLETAKNYWRLKGSQRRGQSHLQLHRITAWISRKRGLLIAIPNIRHAVCHVSGRDACQVGFCKSSIKVSSYGDSIRYSQSLLGGRTARKVLTCCR